MPCAISKDNPKPKNRTADTEDTGANQRTSGRKWRKRWVNNMPQHYHPPCASLKPVNRYRPHLPVKLGLSIRPEEECCPACDGELSPLVCDVSEQLKLISSPFTVIETRRPKLACGRCNHIMQSPGLQNPLLVVMPERSFWPMLSLGNMQTISRYTVVRGGAEPRHAGALDRRRC